MSVDFKAILETTTNDVEHEVPAYGTSGWVLVEILGPGATKTYRYEIEEFQVDNDASTYWIDEMEGDDYWIDQHAAKLAPGWWVFEDVIGIYHHGDGWTTDDDVEWSWSFVRPALQHEIDTLEVIKCPGS